MTIFNALSRTVHFASTRQILQGYTVLARTGLYRNAIQNKFHTESRLCQELPSSEGVPRKFNLSFEDYIKLKSKLKMQQRLIGGFPFAGIGIGLSSITMIYMCPDMFDGTPENVQLILGMDPLVFSGICGVASAGVGYGFGAGVYKLIWQKLSSKADDLDKRDLDFLLRLNKHRFGADSKFEDDYYGETIKTLSDYRQWIRKNRRKKKDYDMANKKEEVGIS